MTKQEFEQIADTKVSDEVYAVINRACLMLSDADARGFCENFAEVLTIINAVEILVDRMVELAQELDEANNTLIKEHEGRTELAARLLAKSTQYDDLELHKEAVKLVGRHEVVRIALKNGERLWSSDLAYLAELLAAFPQE